MFIFMPPIQWDYGLSDLIGKAELSNKFVPMATVRNLGSVRTISKAASIVITPDSGSHRSKYRSFCREMSE